MSEEYWAWMAQYLVMKRASIELNFHGLYSNFLEVVKIPELNRLVLRETFRNIRVSISFMPLLKIVFTIFITRDKIHYLLHFSHKID